MTNHPNRSKKHIIIRELTQGVVVWQGSYSSVAAAIAAYRDELGSEASDYDAVDPQWADKLETEIA
jgi:hypothetical protein